MWIEMATSKGKSLSEPTWLEMLNAIGEEEVAQLMEESDVALLVKEAYQGKLEEKPKKRRIRTNSQKRQK